VRVLLGDPARKVVAHGLRGLCACNCHVDWLAHYNMDSATPQQLQRFLRLVSQTVARI
jgi:NAD(P)H dehydrogenase (quinone)